jgi:hypothetical protein
MRSKLSKLTARRPSPALVISVIALILAIGGTATAALKGKDKTTVRNIATGVVQGLAPGLSVANANNATNSNHATNSDQLGGSPASAYQGRVTGTCTSGNAISAIAQGGSVSCQSTNVTQMTGGSIGNVAPPAGALAPSGLTTPGSFTDVETLSSGVASTASNLEVRVSTAPGPGTFWHFELVLGGFQTGLGCFINNPSTTCSDTSTTDAVAIPAGTGIAFEALGGSAPTATRFEFGWTDTTP